VGDLRVPVIVGTAEAMDKHDRRVAFADDDVVDEWHSGSRMDCHRA
jgi:hypothetical protein